jgi:hypothetical protein
MNQRIFQDIQYCIIPHARYTALCDANKPRISESKALVCWHSFLGLIQPRLRPRRRKSISAEPRWRQV